MRFPALTITEQRFLSLYDALVTKHIEKCMRSLYHKCKICHTTYLSVYTHNTLSHLDDHIGKIKIGP